jgi:selenium metabolism protein YedF
MMEVLMETIDVRNLACPEPVIRTKKALESSTDGKLTVLVNSTEANENVQRFARSQGCEVKAAEKDGMFTLVIQKTQPAAEIKPESAPLLFITSDQLGVGDEALGQLLMASFLNTLPEAKNQPAKMLFINRGVMLTTEGSRVLDSLLELEQKGVQIFSCGACLNHYQLKEKLKVGKVTNMYDTVDSLLGAEKVVRI